MEAADESDEAVEAVLGLIEQFGELSMPNTQPGQTGQNFTKLRIANVRSVSTEIEVPLYPELTLVYGQNGTGKSSIAYALRRLAGEVDAIPVPDAPPSEAKPKVDHACNGSLRTAMEISTPARSWSFPGPCAPVVLMNRHSIRGAMTEGPKDRRTRFDEALGIERTAGALRKLRTDLADVKQTESLPLAIALTSAEVAGLNTCASDEAVEQLIDEFVAKYREHDAPAIANQALAQHAKQALTSRRRPPSIPELDVGAAEAAAAIAMLQDDPPSERGTSRSVLRLYQTATELWEALSTEPHCPLCAEGPQLGDERLQRIRAELAANDELVTRLKRRDAAEATLTRLRTQLDSIGAIDPAASEADEAAAPNLDPTWSEEVLAASRAFDEAGAAHVESLARTQAAAKELVALLRAEATTRCSPEEARSRLERVQLDRGAAAAAADRAALHHAKLDALARADSGQGIAELLAASKEQVVGHQRRRRELTARNKRRDQIRQALTERADTITDAAYSTIAVEVDEWFQILRPAGTADARIERSTSAQRQPVARAYLAGDSLPAVAIMSDSQLETLGIAIRLALIQRRTERPLIVFDDPNDVLDESTRDQFVSGCLTKLIADGYQVMLLTHCSETVSAVWRTHSDRVPSFGQVEIDMETCGTEGCSHTVVTPRDVDTMLNLVTRALARNASRPTMADRMQGSHACRVACELLLQDLLVRVGAERLPADHVETWTLGNYIRALEEWRATLPAEVNGTHRFFIRPLEEFIDAAKFLPGAVPSLNSGSHAGAVVALASQLTRLVAKVREVQTVLPNYLKMKNRAGSTP